MSLSVGFIGTGGIAGAHMPSVAEREDTKIVAVCDLDEARAREAAHKWGATPYSDYKKMIASEKPDAAYVCVPPAAHGTIELDLIKRGIPFLVEKPVNLDIQAAVRVARAARQKNLVTAVGYQVRYAPQMERASDFLSGRQITMVEGWFVGGLPDLPWWRRKAISGGQAFEQTTHIFDLARLFAGEVATVCAFGATGAMTDTEDYDIEDASVALLQFESGAIGHVCSTCVLNKGGQRHADLKVHGRDYTVEATYESLKIHTPDGVIEDDYNGALGPAMKNLDLTFLAAVESGDGSAIRSDYEDGLKSAAISFAVNASMEAGGKPISPAKLLKAAGM